MVNIIKVRYSNGKIVEQKEVANYAQIITDIESEIQASLLNNDTDTSYNLILKKETLDKYFKVLEQKDRALGFVVLKEE